jgi:hypothetical protein
MLFMNDWKNMLTFDPIEPLLKSNHEAIKYYTKRDLLKQTTNSPTTLWKLPEPNKILKKQLSNGSWEYPGKYPEKYPDVNYSLFETFKRLQVLICKYDFTKSHPAIRTACEYILECQTQEGDIRGIYASQYHPHYHAIITEILIQAGYENDPRIHKGIKWLLSVRMNYGGGHHLYSLKD